jgi:hypothetical protein
MRLAMAAKMHSFSMLRVTCALAIALAGCSSSSSSTDPPAPAEAVWFHFPVPGAGDCSGPLVLELEDHSGICVEEKRTNAHVWYFQTDERDLSAGTYKVGPGERIQMFDSQVDADGVGSPKRYATAGTFVVQSAWGLEGTVARGSYRVTFEDGAALSGTFTANGCLPRSYTTALCTTP